MSKLRHSCENCIFFCQHYVWSSNCTFIAANCGHCTKRNITKKDFARFPFNNGCEEWQSKQKEIAVRKENLNKTLIRMATQIDAIMNILDSGFLDS